jgi:hypothetical protein
VSRVEEVIRFHSLVHTNSQRNTSERDRSNSSENSYNKTNEMH